MVTPIRFKLDKAQLYKLLTGDIVSVNTSSGHTVEFFMEDIGVGQIQSVAQQAVADVVTEMTKGH